MANRTVNLVGLDRETLLIIAERACAALTGIANNLTSDEGDEDDTEEEFGLDIEEVIEMAHDNMIGTARRSLDSVIATIADARSEKGS